MENALRTVTAQKENYEEVFAVLVDTANWLKEKGSDQWSDLLQGVDVHKTEKVIENQNVYMAYYGEQLMGVFTLLEKQSVWDSQLWGEDTSQDTVYLHRVALAKSAHGKGNGKKLVELAVKVAKEKKKKRLRLDCISTNNYLNHFYDSIGFVLVEVDKCNEPFSRSSFNLYQRML